jgi:CheY-like chemotaxis protein
MLLRLTGYEVRTAHDGRQALQVAAVVPSDRGFLDIGMPGLNGCEVAWQLRQQLALRRTVLVAMTGFGTDEDRCRSLAAGFAHHLVKSVGFEAVQGLLTALPG